MPKCPNCFYELVLLEHRKKYKCAKCSKLFFQTKIDADEFVKFNKKERKRDKELFNRKPPKKKKLSYLEKIKRSRECQRKYRENNREEYNRKKREYWAKNKEKLNEKIRQRKNKRKAEISAQQRVYRQNNKTLRR